MKGLREKWKRVIEFCGRDMRKERDDVMMRGQGSEERGQGGCFE